MNFNFNVGMPSMLLNSSATTASTSLFSNMFSATSTVAGTGQATAAVANTGTTNATSTQLANYASTNTNAYMDYMNSEYSGIINPTGDVSSLAAQNAGGQVMSGSAVDVGSLRSQYLKANFPGMSDEQIASLGAYYDKYYGAMQETFNSFAAANGSSAVSATSAGALTGTAWGASLARDAEANADGPGGWCYKWVAEALGRHGVSVHGASAYMAADQLAQNDKFREVTGLSNADLKNLPAGAVVVWNKGNGHEHGHICISLGDGREASDKIRNMTQNYGTSYRVFLPQ